MKMGEVLTALLGRDVFRFSGLQCEMAKDGEELVNRREEILARLMDRGLFVAAHKTKRRSFGTGSSRCLSSRARAKRRCRPHPDLVQSMFELRRPEDGSELMSFIHAVNWLYPVLPEVAELATRPRGLLGKCLRLQKAKSGRVGLNPPDWADERISAWECVGAHVAQMASIFRPKVGYQTLAVTDASDLHEGY